jgi:hypothetical protein
MASASRNWCRFTRKLFCIVKSDAARNGSGGAVCPKRLDRDAKEVDELIKLM